ncbi:uncharacterized protein LOC116198800 [Punica granatum]|uniref:Uncharacterized protein n=2 Tax=Punica granatum TaxID=22663 RepID=A0A218XWJ0_PUNGR|nr:uncharacterized protein LOC116198800 [Punica granatum]OWM89324.1 hypothetical protein CDL15_Pgr024069 [Punica granatum]PKI61674.1 hypothetical protein CRG98_017898 [Punica granatum]
MEELGTMWAFEEGVDEMKHKLLCTALELETVKMEASEELKKYKENIKHLLGLLKIAYQERDEARDQLHKLLDKLPPPHPSFNELGSGPAFPLGSQLDNCVVPGKANSSLTESNNSHSPVDSFLEAVSSPDSGSLVLVNQRPNGYVQEYGMGSSAEPKVDPTSSIIDDLAKGKSLPQKGKLLQAVMAPGPLLQTLLVAGPLPRWRNPPPLQPIRIPPMVAINGCDPVGISRMPVSIPNGMVAQKPVGVTSYRDIPCANQQMYSAPMLSFMGSSGYPFDGAQPFSSGQTSPFATAKRQRHH